jgi:hypothetical protein
VIAAPVSVLELSIVFYFALLALRAETTFGGNVTTAADGASS